MSQVQVKGSTESEKDSALVDKFFKMEERYKLFDLKWGDVALWDIFRMHTYLKYHFPEARDNKVVAKRSLIHILKHVTGIIKTSYYFLIKSAKNLILPCSRYPGKDGAYFDKAAMNVVSLLGKDCFKLEWHEFNRRYAYSSANNYVGIIQKVFPKNDSLHRRHFEIIEEALNNAFGECRVSFEELDELLGRFKFERSFYKVLLRLKRFQRVFITQNGLQKGLIKAAHDRGLPVYEFQHGSFEKDHLAYSYPSFINIRSNIIFPDYLLTFSKYWGSYFNVPARKVVPIGNDYFGFQPNGAKKDNSILIVSSMIHGIYLYSWAIDLAKKYPEKQIKFKLHSNEYKDLEFYQSAFSSFSNITIIKNEIDIASLIQAADILLLINSTVAYEALARIVKIAICKKGNYYGLVNLFSMPNVFLVDNVDDIEIALQASAVGKCETFFTPFNKEMFLSLL